jgi:hypothetical protein
MKSLRSKHRSQLKDWLDTDKKVEVSYEDETENIIDHILAMHSTAHDPEIISHSSETLTLKTLRALTKKKIFSRLSS